VGIREQTEAIEAAVLHPRAARAADGRGRVLPEEPCPLRTDFQRDRDRILHAKSFRRLKHKTQVFLSPQGDHYRTPSRFRRSPGRWRAPCGSTKT